MNNERWERVIKLVAESVIKEYGGFWKHIENLSDEAMESKDIITKKELLLVVEILKSYKID